MSETGPNGKQYKKRHSSTEKPRDEWIAVPVPDSGVPREWVDAVREAIKENRKSPSSNRRFWELSGGILRCGCCGYVMRQDARVKEMGAWFYYRCSRRWNRGKDTCPNAKSFNVNSVEPLVWRFVSKLLRDPEQLREDLKRMIERERRNLRGHPDREARVWLQKITEADRMRANYQEMAARGLITFEELGDKLGRLEEGRATAKRELAMLKGRRGRIEQLKRDKEAILESYAGAAPEALNALLLEERHRVYKMLKLTVGIHPDNRIEVSGSLGSDIGICNSETISRR